MQGALRAVPRDGRAVQPVVPAGGPAGAQTPPHPPQLALHLRVGGGGESRRGSGGRASWDRDPGFPLERTPVNEPLPLRPFSGCGGCDIHGRGAGTDGLGKEEAEKAAGPDEGPRERWSDYGAQGFSPEAAAATPRTRQGGLGFPEKTSRGSRAAALCPPVLVLPPAPGGRGRQGRRKERGEGGAGGAQTTRDREERHTADAGSAWGSRAGMSWGAGAGHRRGGARRETWDAPGRGGAGGGQVGARSPCPPPRRPRSRAGALGAGVSRLTLPYLSDPCAELLLRERKRLNSRAGAFPRLEVSCSSRADAGWRSRLAAPKEARKAMEGGEPGGRAGQEGRRARRRACRWKGSHGPGEARVWGGAAGGWPGARRWTGSGTVWVGAGGRGEREDGAERRGRRARALTPQQGGPSPGVLGAFQGLPHKPRTCASRGGQRTYFAVQKAVEDRHHQALQARRAVGQRALTPTPPRGCPAPPHAPGRSRCTVRTESGIWRRSRWEARRTPHSGPQREARAAGWTWRASCAKEQGPELPRGPSGRVLASPGAPKFNTTHPVTGRVCTHDDDRRFAS